MAQPAQDLLRRGIAAAQAGEKDQARALLQQAVRLDPKNETIWLWLSSVARDNPERIFCLRQLLSLNPKNETAIKGLRALGVAVQKSAGDVTGGVPVVSEPALAAAQPKLDALLAEYLGSPEPDLGLVWVVKKKGRHGERSAAYLTAGVVAGVVAVVGLVLVVLAAIFVPQIRASLLPTPSLTPPPATLTPTPTAGPTNTPSPTPRVSPTPSPTYPPEVPNGADAFARTRRLTPTPAYYATQHPLVAEAENAARAYWTRNYDEAIDLAQRARANSPGQERGLLDTFFYEGMSQAVKGNLTQAEDVLRRGLEWEDIALLNAGLGYVYYRMGRYDDSQSANLKAIEQDRDLALPVLTQADVYLARGQFAEALDLVDGALERRRLAYDVNLIVKRGEVYLAMGNYDRAIADARLAQYIDPVAESAYQLAARTNVARGEPGAAVLDLQAYLFYYPGSIPGWTLLGEARYAEGNLNMALAAYDQALVANVNTEDELRAHLSRGNLYLSRGLYPQAYADFDAALGIADSLRAREGRAIAAFQTGRHDVAREDAEAVLAAEPGNAAIQVLLGEALVQLGEYESALTALNAALSLALTPAQQALVNEYLARAHYHIAERQPAEMRDFAPALQAINRALEIQPSGSRYFYRGLILELAGQPALAKADYEWVLAWNAIYDYPFWPEASDRLDAVRNAPALPLATPPAPAGATATPTPES